MRTLIIDNYDSFTYNLVQLLKKSGAQVEVRRNDQILPEETENYDLIVLSPGPSLPDDAGQLKPIIRYLGTKKPILGICLGMQAIAEVFGAQLDRLSQPVHGKEDSIHHTNDPLFQGIPESFKAGRYHSWVVNPESLNDEIEVVAKTDDLIMGIRIANTAVYGLQFHPESVMTPDGSKMISNFLKLVPCTI